MRISRSTRGARIAVAGLLLGACLATPARAQSPAMRPVSDPGGRFTISFPAEWEVQTREGDKPAMIGVAPASGEPVRPNINVVIDALQSSASAEELAQAAEPTMRAIFHEFAVVQEGRMQIGGLPAYFRYYTWRANTGTALYQVQVYMTVGSRAFVITGTTQNDPQRIRDTMPLIVRIINTFRPSGTPQ
jgi:hypothetical protein